MTEELTDIPGIGKSLATDLRMLGYKKTSDLLKANPEKMYSRFNKLIGQKADPCVLYTFRCAVYYANTKKPKPGLLKWWNWKGRLSSNKKTS